MHDAVFDQLPPGSGSLRSCHRSSARFQIVLEGPTIGRLLMYCAPCNLAAWQHAPLQDLCLLLAEGPVHCPRCCPLEVDHSGDWAVSLSKSVLVPRKIMSLHPGCRVAEDIVARQTRQKPKNIMDFVLPMTHPRLASMMAKWQAGASTHGCLRPEAPVTVSSRR